MTSLRTARPADHDAIVDLPGLGGSTRRLLSRDLAGELPRHTVVVERGDVVGFAMTTRQPDEVHLLDLAVAPAHRRSGLATAMVAHLGRRADDDGATAMTLEVRVSNSAAHALYEGLGFTDAGVRPGYYRDGEDARILWHHDLATLGASARVHARRVPSATTRSAEEI